MRLRDLLEVVDNTQSVVVRDGHSNIFGTAESILDTDTPELRRFVRCVYVGEWDALEIELWRNDE